MIKESSDLQSLKSKLVYIEVDFEEVVSKKINILKKNELLLKHISEDAKHSDSDDHHIEGFGVLEVNYPHYKLFAQDLRNTEEFYQKLVNYDVDLTIPTLIITECLLVYMKH